MSSVCITTDRTGAYYARLRAHEDARLAQLPTERARQAERADTSRDFLLRQLEGRLIQARLRGRDLPGVRRQLDCHRATHPMTEACPAIARPHHAAGTPGALDHAHQGQEHPRTLSTATLPERAGLAGSGSAHPLPREYRK